MKGLEVGMLLIAIVAGLLIASSWLPWELIERLRLLYFVLLTAPLLTLWTMGLLAFSSDIDSSFVQKIILGTTSFVFIVFLLPDPVSAAWPTIVQLVVSLVVWGGLFSLLLAYFVHSKRF